MISTRENFSQSNKVQSIAEYQLAISKWMFPIKIDLPAQEAQFVAHSETRNIGLLSIIKATANSPILLRRQPVGTEPENYFMLNIQLDGEIAYVSPNGKVSCGPGSMLLTNQNRVLKSEQLSPAEALVVKVPTSYARQRSHHIDRYCWTTIDADGGVSGMLRDFVVSMWQAAASLSPAEAERLPLIFIDLLDSVFHKESGVYPELSSPEDVLVERLRNEIFNRMSKPKLTSSELAESLCVSRSKLYRATNQAGTTVEQIIQEVRLEWSRNALGDAHLSKLSLTEIAMEAGFCDQAHFSRCFKKRYGMSPSEYRYQEAIKCGEKH